MRRFKYNRTYNIGNSELGKAGEYRVSAELILRNHIIYLPVVDNGVDLVINDNVKIQIKCGQKQPRKCKGYTYNVYCFSFHSTKYAHRNKAVASELKGVDFIVCWAIEDDEFYIIPADKIRGRVTFTFTADEDKRTQVKWNKWLPYRNAWGLLDGEKIDDIKPSEELECKNCGHKWRPLSFNPTRCPSCNSHWNQKMYDHTCKRCNHTWHSRIENPNWCPKCNSYLWNKEKPLVVDYPPITCVRCGHTWKPEVEKPQRCPACHVVCYLGKKPRPYHVVCGRCGYEWDSAKEKLVMCHKCHIRIGSTPRKAKEKELVLA